MRSAPAVVAPVGLAPVGLAPVGLAPVGSAPLGLAPLGLAPVGEEAITSQAGADVGPPDAVDGPIHAGMPVALRQPPGAVPTTVVPACAIPGPYGQDHQVIGFATGEGDATSIVAVSSGTVELLDWSAVAGTKELTPGAVYFLAAESGSAASGSAAKGQIRPAAPSAAATPIVVVKVGRAISPLQLVIEVQEVTQL